MGIKKARGATERSAPLANGFVMQYFSLSSYVLRNNQFAHSGTLLAHDANKVGSCWQAFDVEAQLALAVTF